MIQRNRREFLANVGRGMLVAGVGYHAALDMGLSPALADDDLAPIEFGRMEPLVRMMQETSADKILPAVVSELRGGTKLRELVAAGALANARTFGGEDYIGFHTLMALAPSLHMASELPSDRQALPVLKVLYRNTNRLQEQGGRDREVLKPVAPAELARNANAAKIIRDAVHRRDAAAAESNLAAVARRSPDDAFNALLETVHDSTDVHRVVLAHRAWDMLELVGQERAETMLRQSLRYCLKNEEHSAKYGSRARTILPKMLDQHKLLSAKPGKREADDKWVERMSQTVFNSTPEQAADAVAAALAEGIAPAHVAEAISLATNQLVLRDSGRPKGQTNDNKPLGSVHGDSIGVHACDSANAWRNIARVSNARNTFASLILAGYQAALDRAERGGNFLEWKPRPYQEQLEKITARDEKMLLAQLDGAIREKNQDGACAAVHRYGQLGFPERGVFNVLLGYAISEDGALHAEKYYRTVSDEFAATRPAFRWRQLVALARVTASEYGYPAPGYAEACKLIAG